MEKQKLIVILGPTSSGKTDLSVKLAKKYGGEIISADSRQTYKGLDIGSGKITKRQMRDIPHYLLDVANPKKIFTVAQYQKLAWVAIKKIRNKGKTRAPFQGARPSTKKHFGAPVPFLVGGTGFYIQSIVDGIVIPEVKPNWALRKKLEKKPIEEMFKILKKLDPVRAAAVDSKNPRRLIRAIEIVKSTGRPVPPTPLHTPVYKDDILQIGIKKSPEELKKLIAKRLQKRIKGIIAEVKRLHGNGLSWKRLEELGLEYRFVAQYLQGRLSLPQTIGKIQIESEHFAKRQMTWFKRDQRIHWVKNQKEAEKLVRNFI